MKTIYKILTVIVSSVLISIFGWNLVIMIGNIPPYDDWAGNHEDDLKKIPHVSEFYRHYERDYDLIIHPESGRFYQLGFQALKDDQRAFLRVTFFNGQPHSVSYSCDEGEKHTSLLRIKNAKVSQIVDCFGDNSKDELNFSKLIRNEENQYCNFTNNVQRDQCYLLEDVVFGNARKSWTIYPGGAGWQIPKNSTLEPIYKEIHIGMSSLNFTAMLDDKIFVDKCELNGGVWNYTYHDCEGLWEICRDVDGITVSENITPPCIDAGIVVDNPFTIKACRGAETIRVSCVFEYEN